MKIALAIFALAAGIAWGQDYLDPACMKKYFEASLENCDVEPPPCDECNCPKIGAPCGDGWTIGDMLNKTSCCHPSQGGNRYNPLQKNH